MELFQLEFSKEDLTIFLVLIGILITFLIYHFQKFRPKLIIKNVSTSPHGKEAILLRFYVYNYGFIISENVNCELKEDGKVLEIQRSQPFDVFPLKNCMIQIIFPIKKDTDYKFKLKIKSENHSFKFKKHDCLRYELLMKVKEGNKSIELKTKKLGII